MSWDEYYDSAAQGLRPSSDFEWYAMDRKGQIAILASAGFGLVPMIVFRDKARFFAVASYFESLPLRCDALQRGCETRQQSWRIDAARRGLFAYDWNPSTAGQYVPGQPYELVAIPDQPLNVADVASEVQEWISPIRFDVDFAEAERLFPEQEFEEVNL